MDAGKSPDVFKSNLVAGNTRIKTGKFNLQMPSD